MPSNIDKGKAPSAAGESPAVDPTIWKAIAVVSPNIPPVGSSVYYFSDGHVEQCSSPPPEYGCSFAFECNLAAVNFYADPTTEQVFATFTLSTDFSSPASAKTFSGGCGGVTSVAITLTKSETNYNSKTFLKLPESAHAVFRYSPPGDFVDVYDLNNCRWRFRHVVSGNPPLHLLTNGWSHFVLSKMLVAGDSVVFVRDNDGIIIVGCRRYEDNNCDLSRMNLASSSRVMTRKIKPKKEEAEMIIKAMRWAEEGGEGVVEGKYFPDSKLPVYVAKKEEVENAMRVRWMRGMRVVKRWNLGNGLSYIALGTVIALSLESVDTPWRMLEIIWDETYKTTFENPWEVRLMPIITSPTHEEIEHLPTN